MGIFKKSDPVGTQKTVERNVKGNPRKITFEKTRKRGKNRNLSVKIVKNEPASGTTTKKKSGKVRGVAKGKQLNKKRSSQAKAADKARKAKDTRGPTDKNIQDWRKKPNKMDLKGVDTP